MKEFLSISSVKSDFGLLCLTKSIILSSSSCSDLYGAIGFPLRVARTVVVGKDSKLVEQVINILSYFIRCTEVFEHVQKQEGESIDSKSGANIGEESICSQCGIKSHGELENSDKSCSLTSEIVVCSKCKQKCDGNCSQQCELKDKLDKEFIREQIEKQLHINGITDCSKCGSRNNSAVGKLPGVGMLSCDCTCNGVSSGGLQKELKHFIKETDLSNKSFRCYCCNDMTDIHAVLSTGTTCKCFSDSVSDSLSIHGKQDSTKQILPKESHCLNCLSKPLMTEECKHEGENQANGFLTKSVNSVQRKDVFRTYNHHTDNRVSETDSCLSEDTDSASVRNSLSETYSGIEETISSYGRSGSADSGIHQSPLNSPSAKLPVDFPKAVGHLGEESQIPEEISLPKVVDVNCCPDPNRLVLL